MKRMFLLSIMVMTALMVLSSNASASTYRFYHVAVRDFNGDGAVNGKDHIRYGFTGNDRTPVKAMLYNSTIGTFHKKSLLVILGTIRNHTMVAYGRMNHIMVSSLIIGKYRLVRWYFCLMQILIHFLILIL